MVKAIWDDREGFTLEAEGENRYLAERKLIQGFTSLGEDGAALLRSNPDYVSFKGIGAGDQLPNGAVVLAERLGVILAFNNTGGRDEYVTWRWDGRDLSSTQFGNYWYTLSNAAVDFENRVSRQEEPR